MKSIVAIEFGLLSLILISTCLPATPPGGPSMQEVFVATSPCNESSRRSLQIPASVDCELINWNLTLYRDAKTLTPTTYTLNCVYGLPQQGTTGLSNGGTKVDKQGKWIIAQGTKANPNAVVYKLGSSDLQQSASFLKVDNNLLHLLDLDESLVLGTAGWSYTLNRAETRASDLQPASAFTTSPPQPRSPTTSASAKRSASSIVGRFVGRSPCREVARELNKAVDADCMKVKWDLTLYQDRNTLTPTTYKLNGTFYRQRVREGKWAIVRGSQIDPAAVVYQLDPAGPENSLLFLKADDNVLFFLDKSRNLLVGNADFSYTLNRDR
jgi:hypothetical protein